MLSISGVRVTLMCARPVLVCECELSEQLSRILMIESSKWPTSRAFALADAGAFVLVHYGCSAKEAEEAVSTIDIQARMRPCALVHRNQHPGRWRLEVVVNLRWTVRVL